MAAATPRIIVVGGGLVGLSAVIKITEASGKGTTNPRQPGEVR